MDCSKYLTEDEMRSISNERESWESVMSGRKVRKNFDKNKGYSVNV